MYIILYPYIYYTHTHTNANTHAKEPTFTVYSIVQRQQTPLHCAALDGDSGTVRVLVEAKADVLARDTVCVRGGGRGWVGEWVSGWVDGWVGKWVVGVMNRCVHMCA